MYQPRERGSQEKTIANSGKRPILPQRKYCASFVSATVYPPQRRSTEQHCNAGMVHQVYRAQNGRLSKIEKEETETIISPAIFGASGLYPEYCRSGADRSNPSVMCVKKARLLALESLLLSCTPPCRRFLNLQFLRTACPGFSSAVAAWMLYTSLGSGAWTHFISPPPSPYSCPMAAKPTMSSNFSNVRSALSSFEVY